MFDIGAIELLIRVALLAAVVWLLMRRQGRCRPELPMSERCGSPSAFALSHFGWALHSARRCDPPSAHEGNRERYVYCGEVTPSQRPLRLAIVDDYAVVVAGVASLLADEHIDVVETDASRPVLSDVDVVLYDTFGQIQGRGIDLEDFVRDSGAKVVVYSWNVQPETVEQAIAAGACGYLSKVLTGAQVVAGLRRVVAGEVVIQTGDDETSVGGAGDWPGRSIGLSPREAEVIALIAQGLSNQEIADRVYLSINSIKTYVRSAYRKIGVTSRSQAVIWALDNGFKPDKLRTVDPTLVLRRPR